MQISVGIVQSGETTFGLNEVRLMGFRTVLSQENLSKKDNLRTVKDRPTPLTKEELEGILKVIKGKVSTTEYLGIKITLENRHKVKLDV